MSGTLETDIDVICPVYNEESFIVAHIQNCLRFAHEIHYGDTGCTDDTLFIIDSYARMYPGRIHLHDLREFVRKPYDWDEGMARNYLISRCDSEWICNLDADELWGKEFFADVQELVRVPQNFIRFTQYAFWYYPFLLRVRQFERDWWRRFYPGGRQYRLFRNEPYNRYAERGNHAHLSFHGFGKWSPRLSMKDVEIPFYHYHHTRGPKENDNRGEERSLSGIRLNTFFGEHPKEIEWYDWFLEGASGG